MSKISQKEWNKRAARINMKWLENIQNSTTKASIKCLKCKENYEMLPSSLNSRKGCISCILLKKHLNQKEWDRRAKLIHLKWMEPVKNSRTPVKIKCSRCNNQWKIAPKQLRTKIYGCRNCSFDSLKVSQQEWEFRAAKGNLQLIGEIRRSHDLARVKCLICNYEFKAKAYSISNGSSCPICAKHNQIISLKEVLRRIESINAISLKELKENIPNHPLLLKCNECNYVWKTQACNMLVCKKCLLLSQGKTESNRRCFGINEPGRLCLLCNFDGIFKIGITNNRNENRINRHKRYGFNPIKMWLFPMGIEAQSIENCVLRWWRNDLQLPEGIDPTIDGHTETVSSELMNLETLINFIETKIKEHEFKPVMVLDKI